MLRNTSLTPPNLKSNVLKALRNATLIVGVAAAIAALIWGGSSARMALQVKVSPPKTEAQRATEGPLNYQSPDQRKDTQIRLACYCATDYDSIGPVLRAYKDSDIAALAGLIGRGKAIELAKGTHVYVAGRQDGSRPCGSNQVTTPARSATCGGNSSSDHDGGHAGLSN